MKRKTFIASLIAIAGMLSPSAYAQLLKGTARLGEDYEFAVNYLPEGNLFLAQLNDVEVKADGSYTFDMDRRRPLVAMSINCSSSSAIPPPVPPSVKAGRTITG